MSLYLIAKALLWSGIIAAAAALLLYRKNGKRIAALTFTAWGCWGIVGHGLISFHLGAERSFRDTLAIAAFGAVGLITTVLIGVLLVAKRRDATRQKEK